MDDVYNLYCDNVYKYLVSLTSNLDLAEELTQETFYQAIKSIGRYNGSCKMSVWLCQIAKYTYYNYLKKHKKGIVSLDEAANEDGIISLLQSINAEELILRSESEVNLYRYVLQLSEPYKEIFLIKTSTEMSFRDIGEIFNKSENWARVTYYRAKIKLVERIENNGY
jgi:RNA polymerase sigma factor (sigma-70 family)